MERNRPSETANTIATARDQTAIPEMTTLYVMIGIPGSGKSTVAGLLGLPVVSTDAIRLELTGDAEDQSANDTVYAVAHARTEQHLACGESVVFDATNLTGSSRRPLRKMAHSWNARLVACLVDVDEATARERNRSRERVVPEFVMDRMIGQFAASATREALASGGFEVRTPDEIRAEVEERYGTR